MRDDGPASRRFGDEQVRASNGILEVLATTIWSAPRPYEVAVVLVLVASAVTTAGIGWMDGAPARLRGGAGEGAEGGPYRNARFAVIGDFGAGTSAQLAIARRMCRWHESHPFSFVLTTGDNIYPDGARRHFRGRFFRPYRCLRRRGVRFHATLGNHDYVTRRGQPELREPRFGLRARNYVFHRRSVRFVVADSNVLNRRWLARASRPRGRP